jgi:hypothetical protein
LKTTNQRSIEILQSSLNKAIQMAEPGTDYVTGGGQPIPAAEQAKGSGAPILQKSHEGEYHGDFGTLEVPITRSVKLYAFCAAINSCNFGYDVGSSSKKYNCWLQ